MRKTWVLVAAVVVLVVGALGVFIGGGEEDHLPAQQAARLETTSAAGLPAYPPTFLDHRPSNRPKTIVVELCDHGKMEIGPDRGLYPPRFEAAADNLLLHVADSLAASDDAGVRAVASYFGAMRKSISAREAARSLQKDCESDPACVERLKVAGAGDLRKAADRLAAEVGNTRDGRAYAMAWYLCGKAYPPQDRSGPCMRVTAQRWAQIEPDNVMPWFAEAERASAGGDRVVLDAAMQGAAAATRSETHWGTLVELAAHPLFETADRATQLVALTWLAGVRAAMPLPSPYAVRRLCQPSETMTEERRQQCQAIAAALTRGSTLLELGLGVEVGRAAGWPEEKASALRAKVDAISALHLARVPAGDFFSCRFLDAMKESLVLGDLRAGEAALERGGRPARDVAAEHRAATFRPGPAGQPAHP